MGALGHVYLYVYICVYMYTYVHTYIYMFIYIYIHIYVYIYVYICIYICIYICTYICIYMYIYEFFYMSLCTIGNVRHIGLPICRTFPIVHCKKNRPIILPTHLTPFSDCGGLHSHENGV